MHYTITPLKPHERTIAISLELNSKGKSELHVAIPSWRPGRYEIANFARNIRKWEVLGSNGERLQTEKKSKDEWIIKTEGSEMVTIRYEYYAAELNAGSTWIDEHQLYVNPVNCLVYLADGLDEPCTLSLVIPASYDVAGALKKKEGKYHFSNYHELADTPFIASDQLEHNYFVYEGIEFHLWFHGIREPEWSRLLNDFFLFTHEQYTLFGSFPTDTYHYLFQMVPYNLHHGVEHQHSTVIALGPALSKMRDEGYYELVGICSHELFHTWNVKNIRPLEMMPYQYNKENYSRQGYVYEGVTTYYGDLMLYRSQIYGHGEYLSVFNKLVQRHFDNPGRHNMPVADASFDTWLDGYVPGIPGRKTNIYNEGALTAFLTDVSIRKGSGGKHSLDDVMRTLYEDFGKKSVGYSAADYRRIAENFAGSPLSIFDELIFGPGDFSDYLKSCLDYLGLTFTEVPALSKAESLLGLKLLTEQERTRILAVHPGSAADRAGLAPGDEIIALDSIRIINPELHFKDGQKVSITLFRDARLKTIEVTPSPNGAYRMFRVNFNARASGEQKKNFASWSSRAFPS